MNFPRMTVLLVFIWLSAGCGGSTPSPKTPGEGAPPPDVISLKAPGAVPDAPELPPFQNAQEKQKEGKGIFKVYWKAYDHCAAQGGCEEEDDVETEEDRQRYSVPYRRK